MTLATIPEGYHTVTPYLAVKNAGDVIGFLKSAFGAEEIERTELEDGRILNAEIKIGDSMLMVAEAREGFERPGTMYLYVPDTDEAYTQALEAGATSIMEPADQYYGDRNAGVEDMGGNQWWIATHFEDVSSDEMLRRAIAREEEHHTSK